MTGPLMDSKPARHAVTQSMNRPATAGSMWKDMSSSKTTDSYRWAAPAAERVPMMDDHFEIYRMCGNAIDPDICRCGEDQDGHWTDHFIPAGCYCGRKSSPDE